MRICNMFIVFLKKVIFLKCAKLKVIFHRIFNIYMDVFLNVKVSLFYAFLYYYKRL